MKFDISNVYSAATADHLEPGDQVIAADDIGTLRRWVLSKSKVVIKTLHAIQNDLHPARFLTEDGECHNLAYLVKKLEYRPFKSEKELVEVFEKIANILPYDNKFFMPFIWIKNKETGDKELILTFGKDRYYTENTAGDMKALLDYYTFLDGTPCGVKK